VEPFLEFGGNGVILAMVLAAFKALEARASKKNGSVSARVESIEKSLEILTNEFRSFRQEVAERQLKEDIIKEISHEQQTGS
jgi:hypothetical protein|tara:strand:+ start:198 stop:443 length:246 start_codon:yes stop_codon:yes gene_type:complete